MEIKKIFLIILTGVIAFSPALLLAAQFNAQQNYPNIGGGKLISDSASESIPALVKYLFNIAVWVCILVSILVLILGGIQYVTSSGDVGKMTGAKTRIYGSLLGLIILVGAWFVLHTVNPSFVLPKITYSPIKQGVILFTEDGLTALANAQDESIINDLIQGGDAFRLNYDLPDLTQQFGELVVYSRGNNDEPTELNFENFKLKAIGFWGMRNYNSVVTFYSKKNYISENRSNIFYFSASGQVDEKGDPVTPANNAVFNSNIKGLQYIMLVNSRESVGYLAIDRNVNGMLNPILAYPENRTSLTLLESGIITPNAPLHPPMSLKLSLNAPGVYLSDADGNERYFDSSVNDFKRPEINFDQKAQDIKIVNDVEYKYKDENGENQVKKETNDFLAILHEEDTFAGNLKIYFQERRTNNDKGKNKNVPKFDKFGVPSKTNGRFDYYNQDFAYGNLPSLLPPVITKEPISFIAKKIYGLMPAGKKPASISVFALADDPKACQEVMLCSEKQGRGNCIAYEAEGISKTNESNIVYYPMPVYVPVNIPCHTGLDSSSGCEIPQFKTSAGEMKPFSLANEVKSIIMKPEGKCAVVLFENHLNYPDTSPYSYPSSGEFAPNAYAGGYTGSHSEVFNYSDYDLEDNQIGLCGSVGVFNRQIGRECASAIVVYPLK